MDNKLLQSIDSFIAENEENIVRDIGRLVSINSVLAPAEENAPFGRACAEALKLGLEIAGELGLETRNCEDKIGYAQIGHSEEYVASITHLDVVPAGEGWTGDPFLLREREGYLIGRGIMDDKGPAVICLYALKFIKDSGIQLRRSVRAILGINEETGMEDVEYYLENYPAPVFCFSPDSEFPVCHGEKGGYNGRIISNMPMGNVVDIKGGVAANVIPDKAQAWVKAEKLESTDKVSAVEEDGLWHLTAKGVGGHASVPQGTVNAIGVLVDYILDNGICTEDEEKYFSLLRLLHSATDGSNVGAAADDGLFSPLTIIGGVIYVEDGHIVQVLDSRYTTNTNGAKITAAIQAVAGDVAQVVTDKDSKPFYISADHAAIKTCIDTYREITGDETEPYTMGGGTYARHFPLAVAFGPENPKADYPQFCGPIHGADEAGSKAELLRSLKIYILTLLRLDEVDF